MKEEPHCSSCDGPQQFPIKVTGGTTFTVQQLKEVLSEQKGEEVEIAETKHYRGGVECVISNLLHSSHVGFKAVICHKGKFHLIP